MSLKQQESLQNFECQIHIKSIIFLNEINTNIGPCGRVVNAFGRHVQ